MTTGEEDVSLMGDPGTAGKGYTQFSKDGFGQPHFSHHSRGFFHYCDNAMDAKWFVFNKAMKPEDSTAWSDDGWQHRSLLSSVNTTDWKALTTNNRAMRVKSFYY